MDVVVRLGLGVTRHSGLGLKGPHRACRLSAHSFDRRAAAALFARKRFRLETAIVEAAGGGRRAVVVFCHEETKSGFLAPDLFCPFRRLHCVFSSFAFQSKNSPPRCLPP